MRHITGTTYIGAALESALKILDARYLMNKINLLYDRRIMNLDVVKSQALWFYLATDFLKMMVSFIYFIILITLFNFLQRHIY